MKKKLFGVRTILQRLQLSYYNVFHRKFIPTKNEKTDSYE